MSTPDGKQLASYMYRNEPPEEIAYESEYKWPRQKTGKAVWKVFTGQIRKILCHGSKYLKEPLGRWKQNPKQWNWRYSET